MQVAPAHLAGSRLDVRPRRAAGGDCLAARVYVRQLRAEVRRRSRCRQLLLDDGPLVREARVAGPPVIEARSVGLGAGRGRRLRPVRRLRRRYEVDDGEVAVRIHILEMPSRLVHAEEHRDRDGGSADQCCNNSCDHCPAIDTKGRRCCESGASRRGRETAHDTESATRLKKQRTFRSGRKPGRGGRAPGEVEDSNRGRTINRCSV